MVISYKLLLFLYQTGQLLDTFVCSMKPSLKPHWLMPLISFSVATLTGRVTIATFGYFHFKFKRIKIINVFSQSHQIHFQSSIATGGSRLFSLTAQYSHHQRALLSSIFLWYHIPCIVMKRPFYIFATIINPHKFLHAGTLS